MGLRDKLIRLRNRIILMNRIDKETTTYRKMSEEDKEYYFDLLKRRSNLLKNYEQCSNEKDLEERLHYKILDVDKDLISFYRRVDEI